MSDTPNTFHVGLCMAGAISAGAYTAGVMDYLLEALDDWQKRKEKNEANVPTHNVVIPVMGGASAGGMTSIITASALHDEITYVHEAPVNLHDSITWNKLYHSWVDLTDNDMLTALLN